MVCTSDGSKVIVCDFDNEKLRTVDLVTYQMSTLSVIPKYFEKLLTPQCLAFDRATTTPDSVLYITRATYEEEGLQSLNLLTSNSAALLLYERNICTIVCVCVFECAVCGVGVGVVCVCVCVQMNCAPSNCLCRFGRAVSPPLPAVH